MKYHNRYTPLVLARYHFFFLHHVTHTNTKTRRNTNMNNHSDPKQRSATKPPSPPCPSPKSPHRSDGTPEVASTPFLRKSQKASGLSQPPGKRQAIPTTARGVLSSPLPAAAVASDEVSIRLKNHVLQSKKRAKRCNFRQQQNFLEKGNCALSKPACLATHASR